MTRGRQVFSRALRSPVSLHPMSPTPDSHDGAEDEKNNQDAADDYQGFHPRLTGTKPVRCLGLCGGFGSIDEVEFGSHGG